ncbi:sensor histidine kinase [Azospirillum canadense]|uniref:sensor histidine kinase n=1 Tax=Azospirillum canadense TaxID=403962 RepID=UPI0022275384|nr:ATP-binding protein [Azospirillum canadense]MCW2235440.1 signal transduction histidine kinase [Azospirillum canadense]
MTALPLAEAEIAGLEFLEGLATPLWLIRQDGGTVWLNASARAALDLPPEGPASLLHLVETAELRRAMDAVAAGHRASARIRFRCGGRWEDGIPAEVDVLLAPAPCRGGLVLVEAPADGGARREAMRLNEQLVALSYAYPDIRFELRRDGTILDFAAASPGDLNVPAERFLNQRVQEVLPEPAAGLMVAALDRLNGGDLVTALDFTLPALPNSRESGDKSFEAQLVALMDGDRILCSIRNVTERVRAEREARRAHDRLLDAIECITEGFVLYDPDDRLVLCNSRYRDLFSDNTDLMTPGTPFETVLRVGAARGVYRIAPEELEGWIARRINQHRTGGPPMEVQLVSGRWIRIEEWRTKEDGTVGIRADITDLKAREADLRAARDEAERANRRKSDYVHHLSHELRTPLNAVLGFSEIIRDEMMGPNNPRYRDYAGQITAAGVYMLDLINNLLDLAKIEAGRMDLHEEACNLALLVDLTFGMMHPRAAEAAVRLVMDIPDDLPGVHGDASLIRQMLTNLVGNAIKFARPPGKGPERTAPERCVTVRAARTGDGGILLSVADNGIGMRPEQIPAALDSFRQVHQRDIATERGSGLGLPLTRALIALHGGSFRIDSALGIGTTVFLEFPASRVCESDGFFQ